MYSSASLRPKCFSKILYIRVCSSVTFASVMEGCRESGSAHTARWLLCFPYGLPMKFNAVATLQHHMHMPISNS